MNQSLAEVRAAAEDKSCWIVSTNIMRDYILSTIPADAESPATAEWAASVFVGDLWGDEFVCRTRHDDNVRIVQSKAVYVYRQCLGTMTRYQFSMLAQALGIKPKQ